MRLTPADIVVDFESGGRHRVPRWDRARTDILRPGPILRLPDDAGARLVPQSAQARSRRGRTDPALKWQITDNLKRRHHERRQPYVMLIAELQKHLASTMADDLQATG
jgi:hypothetical protein